MSGCLNPEDIRLDPHQPADLRLGWRNIFSFRAYCHPLRKLYPLVARSGGAVVVKEVVTILTVFRAIVFLKQIKQMTSFSASLWERRTTS